MRGRRRNRLDGRTASRVAVACLALAALGLGGCALVSEYVDNGFKVGPNYAPPAVPLPPKWIDEDRDPRVAIGAPNLACWWDVFGDPTLTELIHRSYSSNLTLRAYALQIMSAEQQRRIAASELLPQSQTAALSYTHSQVSATGGAATGATGFFGTGLTPPSSAPPVSTPNTPIAGMLDPGPGTTSTDVSTGGIATAGGTPVGAGVGRFLNNWATSLNMSWELDFWGLYRRNLEAATASLDQSIFNSDEATVLILADVATMYVQIRTTQRRLELARRNVALQEPLVAQFEQRYRAGVANSLPGYAQLRSNLENTRALIPQLEITLREANNQLCNRLGIPMQDLATVLGDGTVSDPAHPERHEVRIPQPISYSVVVGIPGDVLLQRPDVKAAEQQLKIQSAEIGISEAEMLPHVGVNGSIGLASSSFNRLFGPQSGTGSIGPSLSWNILNYGRLLANVRIQNLVYQQFVAQYQQSLLNANQDAENALTAYLRSIEQASHLRQSAASAAELTDYLVRQFRQGYLPPGAPDTSSFINQMFTAVNFQVQQQDAAAQAEGNIALNLILLYRAMGGGWQLRLTDAKNGCVQGCGGSGTSCGTANQSVAVGPAPIVGPLLPVPAPSAPTTQLPMPAPLVVPPLPAGNERRPPNPKP
jgi:NodT family efflux transporter outer membrane factor (OMF) lipoprotein